MRDLLSNILETATAGTVVAPVLLSTQLRQILSALNSPTAVEFQYGNVNDRLIHALVREGLIKYDHETTNTATFGPPNTKLTPAGVCFAHNLESGLYE